ncbi:MAG: hypothetical protein Crog4KO_20430 [Crocinitomicaceae bacterium]
MHGAVGWVGVHFHLAKRSFDAISPQFSDLKYFIIRSLSVSDERGAKKREEKEVIHDLEI